MCSRPCFAARQVLGARERLERAPPLARGDRRVAVRHVALQRDAAPPQAPLRQRRIGEEGRRCGAHSSRQVSARKRRACRRTWSARLAMRSRGSLRATPDGVEGAEQLEGAVLVALGDRDARQGAIAEQHGLGQAAALQHVEPVRRAARRLGGRSRSHTAAASSAASMQVKGLRRPRSPSAPASVGRSRLLGQQHLALPQIAQPDDEVAPAVDVAGAAAEVGARRLLLAQARQRRLAFEQRAERVRFACTCSSSGSLQRRATRPRGRAARRSGRDRRRRSPRRPGSARIRSAGRRRRRVRQDALDQPAGLVVAFAERRGSRRRPATGAAGGPALRRAAGRATQHRALAPARHHRFVEAALGQLVGHLAPGRTQGRGAPRPRAGPCSDSHAAARACSVGLLVRGQGVESRPQRIARQRVHAQPVAALRRRRRPACRAPARRGARRRRAATRTPHRCGMQVVEERDARQQTEVGRREVGEQQADELLAQAAAAGASAAISARGSAPADITVSASCSPSGQPSAISCRRAAASWSTRGAEPAAHQRDRLAELEAQLRRADDDGTGRSRRGRRCRAWQSVRAATTTRRLAGALRNR